MSASLETENPRAQPQPIVQPTRGGAIADHPRVITLMMPDYRRDNPYQQMLADAIEAAGCGVEFPNGYRRVLPIYRAVREHREAKLLHLHWTGPYLKGGNRFLFICWAAKFLTELALVRLSGRRIVWTVHNLVPHEARYPRLERWVRRWICRFASAVIVHGPAGRQAAISQFKCRPENIRVVPHGNYLAAYKPAPLRDTAARLLGIQPRRKCILFLGMVRPYKGIPDLLRAWENVAGAEDALLVIAGKAELPFAETVKAQIKDSSRVSWHDKWISAEEASLYFAIADAAVFPFERVLTSGSMILAMGYGKPIIAPKLGEIPETLSEADDLTYSPDDPEGLERCLRRALEVDLDELAARTLAVAKRYDWGPIGAATARIYRQVLKCGPTESASHSVP